MPPFMLLVVLTHAPDFTFAFPAAIGGFSAVMLLGQRKRCT
jgi:hypothetical protein